MEITIIHGQTRHGSTFNITTMLKNEFLKRNAIIHEFKLPTAGPTFCIGCFNCIEKSELKCPHIEDTREIYNAMIASQIIIIDSPTYCLEMSGQLKTFFDHFGYMWLPHRPREEMFSKIGICISTAAGGGAKHVTKTIAKQLFWWGVPKTFKLDYIVAASSWDMVSEKKKEKIAKEIKIVVRKVTKKVGKIKVGFKTKFLFLIMRLMHKKNNWNLLDHNYWKDKNWLGKTRPW